METRRPAPKPLTTVIREKLATLPLLGVFALLAVALAIGSLVSGRRDERLSLRISAGDLHSHRAEIARALIDEAETHGLDIELVETDGSLDAADQVQSRALGAAIIQGGLDVGPDVREVAVLAIEPLHLLVAPDASIFTLEDLRGLRVQLSPPGSGTRELALDVLALAGLEEDDVHELSLSYTEIEEIDPEQLPDAVFTVSSLPSPTARFLIEERSYELMALPYAGAISQRRTGVLETVIPAYTYGAAPAIPRTDLTTMGTRMIVVARVDTPIEIVRRLIESLQSPRFLRHAHLRPPIDDLAHPELPLHDGTLAWMRRDDPALTSDTVQGIESFRSFLVSLIVACVLLWRWWRSRRTHGFDGFIREVSTIEQDALELERSPVLDLAKLLGLRARLGATKQRALRAFADGKVHSEELLSSFLTHVSDVRSHLNAMILHERARLEKKARTLGDAESDAMREMWQDALEEAYGERELAAPKSAAGERAPAEDEPKGEVGANAAEGDGETPAPEGGEPKPPKRKGDKAARTKKKS